MENLVSVIGGIAAALTSLSYIPQVRKAWPANSTADLSVKTLTALTTGLALWLVYGCMKGDWVIISANGVGGGLSATVLACKLRDMFRGGAPSSS